MLVSGFVRQATSDVVNGDIMNETPLPYANVAAIVTEKPH